MVARRLSADKSIQVVATADDPFDARDKILKYDPDVIICDVEMPKMNGIEFIKRLLPQYPLPVVVVSSNPQTGAEARKSRRPGFCEKPNANYSRTFDDFLFELDKKFVWQQKQKSFFLNIIWK